MAIGDKVYIADKPTLDATKAEVETKASQTSVNTANTNINTINTNIGATNNTGGSSTTGTVMAKLNAILTWFTGTWTSARAGYLDTTVSSRATQAYAESAYTNIMSRADVATSTRESEANALARYNSQIGYLAAIQAYVDTLETTIAAINANTVRGAVKSVQRGVITVPRNTDKFTITISAVEPNKCHVSFTGNGSSSQYVSTDGGYSEQPRVVSLSSTTITAANFSSPSVAYTIGWEVIEFY